MLLPQHMLVASNAFGAGTAKMAARNKAGAAAPLCHSGGEIKQLNIESLGRGFEDSIDMQMLSSGRPCRNMMDEVMIKHRVRSNERFNNPCDGRQPQHLTEG